MLSILRPCSSYIYHRWPKRRDGATSLELTISSGIHGLETNLASTICSAESPASRAYRRGLFLGALFSFDLYRVDTLIGFLDHNLDFGIARQVVFFFVKTVGI